MSYLRSSALKRREFFRLALTSAGAVAVLQFKPLAEAAEGSAHWAFMSDTHIPPQDDHAKPQKGLCYYNQHAHIQQGVKEILAAKPQGTIITGDLARTAGEMVDYQQLEKFLGPLAAKLPVFYGIGNHDDRVNFEKVFTKLLGQRQAVPEKVVQIVEAGPVRFVILDSMMAVNKPTGQLGKAQLEWLSGYVEKTKDKPICLCVHHNPGFPDWADLEEIIGPAKAVKAVIFGHSHVYDYKEKRGVHLINLPAMGYAFKETQPVGWVEAKFSATGGAFTLHRIEGPKDEDGKAHELKWRA